MSDDRLAEIESRSTEAVAMANYSGRPDAAEQALEAIETYYSMDVPWLIDEVKRLRALLVMKDKLIESDTEERNKVCLRTALEIDALRDGIEQLKQAPHPTNQHPQP